MSSNNVPEADKTLVHPRIIMNYPKFFDGYLDYCLDKPFNYDDNTISYERGRMFAIMYGKETPVYDKEGLPLPEAVEALKTYMEERLVF